MRETKKYNLKLLLGKLVSEQLFGSRAYKTGSLRSDGNVGLNDFQFYYVVVARFPIAFAPSVLNFVVLGEAKADVFDIGFTEHKRFEQSTNYQRESKRSALRKHLDKTNLRELHPVRLTPA